MFSTIDIEQYLYYYKPFDTTILLDIVIGDIGETRRRQI